VLVELMGGDGNPAKAAVETALAAGKSVVTANKALLAKHGLALAALAEKHGGALNFEAAVGGAIPIVKTLREGMSGNSFARVYGILNGTCNYILTRMAQEKLSFAECLKDAQRLGYAEADPTFDVEGFDTARSSPSWRASRSAPASTRMPSMWKAFRRSRRRISMPPTRSATGSSCSASPCGPSRGSSSGSIPPWCRRTAPSPR